MIKADIMRTQKWGANDYNSCAGVIANSPDLDADDYIELHEGRRHGLSWPSSWASWAEFHERRLKFTAEVRLPLML